MAVGISTSGNSGNVLRAMETFKEKGIAHDWPYGSSRRTA